MAQIILRKVERLINISLISGVFTAPLAGVYLITFSYMSGNDPNEFTNVHVHKNSQEVSETRTYTYYPTYSTGQMWSTVGRAVYQKLEAGDTINLHATWVQGGMQDIMFCVQFINN